MSQRVFLALLGICASLFLSHRLHAQEIANSFAMPVDYPYGNNWDLHGGWGYLENESSSGYEYHPGEDLNYYTGADTDCGMEVRAAANGIVTEAKNFGSGWGNIIEIKSTLSSGQNVWLIYAHEQEIYVQPGNVITQGQLIGLVGGGYNHEYYCHLHFEVRTTDLPANNWPVGYSAPWIEERYENPRDFITAHQSGISPSAQQAIEAKADELWAIGRTSSTPGLIAYERTNGDMHWYSGVDNPYIIEDWEGGQWGWVAITYNNRGDNAGKAYVLHHTIWEVYRNNDGPDIFGAPLGDELNVIHTTYTPYDPYCTPKYGSSVEGMGRCIEQYCGSTDQFSAMQRFEHSTLCWDEIHDTLCTVDGTWTPCELAVLAPPPPTHIDPTTFTYSSLDLTSQAAVDYADLRSHPTCAVNKANSLYVVLNGQNHRIYELKTTNDGTTWSSTDLSAQASVPYSATGTSPHLFIDPSTGDRYVTFMGDTARVQLFRFHGGIWTAVDLTSQAAVPYADPTTSPFGYIANGVVYVVFQGNNRRIYRFAWNGSSYSALDLSAQASVTYAQPGTSPMAVYNPTTGEHHIVFQGDNHRIQRLTWNGTTWSSVEITSVINSDLLDSLSQPWTYVDSATGYVYTVINGVNQRIDYIVDKHTSWSSAELTSIVNSPLVEISSSPVGYIDPFTGHSIITFLGDNLRVNQFEGPAWTNVDLTAQTPVMYAASGTSPATCMDTTTGVRHTVFVGDNARIQYIRFGP